MTLIAPHQFPNYFILLLFCPLLSIIILFLAFGYFTQGSSAQETLNFLNFYHLVSLFISTEEAIVYTDSTSLLLLLKVSTHCCLLHYCPLERFLPTLPMVYLLVT